MSDPIFPLRQWPAGIQQASVPANDNALREEAVKRVALGVVNDASGSDGDMWIVGGSPSGNFASFEENDIALRQFGSWYAWAPTDGLRLIVNDVPKIYVGGGTNAWQDDTSDGIADAPSDGSTYGRKDGSWEVVAGTGDVTGPASSTDGNLAVFDGATGKLLKDGGALGGMAGINDAPSDGTGYVRKDGAWVAESGGGGSDNITLITEASTSTMDPATHSGRSKLILAADDVTFDNTEGYTAGDVFNICATSALDLLVSGVTLTPPSGGTTGLSADMTVSVVMTSSTAGRIIGQTVAA